MAPDPKPGRGAIPSQVQILPLPPTQWRDDGADLRPVLSWGAIPARESIPPPPPLRGCSSMAERRASNSSTRVRFPLSAPHSRGHGAAVARLVPNQQATGSIPVARSNSTHLRV